MDLVQKPALQRRRLQRRLTRLREDTGMTQLQVSKRLRWSQSKMNRVENGDVGLSYTDLSALLKLYEVEDEEVVETMAKMAEIAKRPSLAGISEIYPDRAFRRYLELEEIASRMKQFENSFVPGLLQTEGYAKTVLNTAYGIHGLVDPELAEVKKKIERIVTFRRSRQKAFDAGSNGGELKGSFVLDEAVIRRMVGAESGSTVVMVEQLQRLKVLSRHEQIDICAVPFSAGTNLGMPGSFVILGFPDVDDAPLLYIENSIGDFATSEDGVLTGRFSAAFEALQAQAVWGSEFEALVDDAIASMS